MYEVTTYDSPPRLDIALKYGDCPSFLPSFLRLRQRDVPKLPELGCLSLATPYSTSRTFRGAAVVTVLRK
jgi:hypothetical protein